MLVLHVIQGPDRGKKYELPPHEPQLIGRSTEALPISDTTVSRRHAELTPDDGKWYLRDLDSSNGTFVNGKRITGRVELLPGDQIRCGSTLLSFAATPDSPARDSSTIRLLPPEAFDVTVERTIDQSGESMVLGEPDPMRAAPDHLRVIYDLTAITAGAFEQDDLLQKVMNLVFGEFRPDRGFILLMNDAEAVPTPAAVRYREHPRTIDEGRIPVSRTIIQHALKKRAGLLTTNAMNDTRFQAGDSVRDYGIRSAVCVPIMAGDRVFGVIHIDSQLVNFTFTESQLLLLSAIGQHTGLALLNLELVKRRVQTERLAAVGEAVASVSHSIKNILQGLRGGADAVELAINRGDLELAQQGWAILARNLDRILSLTLNMLTYSKPPTLDLELNSINALINDVAELIRPQCERKRAALMMDLEEELPPIPFDATAMHQALMNILINAVEAVSSKTGVVTARSRFDESRQQAIIEVSDNGPGIAEEFRRSAFEPFVSSKGQRGTGLGLAVTRKIVREHRGAIELHSEPKGGTTVRIILPADQETFDAGKTQQPRPMPGDAGDL